MVGKRKIKQVEEKKIPTPKRAKLSTTTNSTSATRTNVSSKSVSTAKSRSGSGSSTSTTPSKKPRGRSLARDQTKTTTKSPSRSRGLSRGRATVSHSKAKRSPKSEIKSTGTPKVIESISPARRQKEWEEKAAKVLKEHLQQMSGLQDSPKKSLEAYPAAPDCGVIGRYLHAYWNLPALKHRDEAHPCFFRACIFDGYRDRWGWYEATVSLFSMHNETMCIWSHLIPFFCAVMAAVWLGLQMLSDGSTVVEQLMMGIFICTACSCLLLSSVYHWYGCMSEGHYFCLLSMDLGGIASLIAGSFFPGVYYGIDLLDVSFPLLSNVFCRILLHPNATEVLYWCDMSNLSGWLGCVCFWC